MNVNAAVKKRPDNGALPSHAWKNDTGKASGRGKIVMMRGEGMGISPLTDGQANERLGRLILEKAGTMKARAPSQAEKNAWAARLLEENIMRDNHSC